MYTQPVICIFDDDKERCLREEDALDAAIAACHVDAVGISNYGEGSIARSGYKGVFPVIEVHGLFFTPKEAGRELTEEDLCAFLNMLLRKGTIRLNGSI